MASYNGENAARAEALLGLDNAAAHVAALLDLGASIRYAAELNQGPTVTMSGGQSTGLTREQIDQLTREHTSAKPGAVLVTDSVRGLQRAPVEPASFIPDAKPPSLAHPTDGHDFEPNPELRTRCVHCNQLPSVHEAPSAGIPDPVYGDPQEDDDDLDGDLTEAELQALQELIDSGDES